MCYESLHLKSKTENAEKQEQPKVVAKYQYKPATSQPEPVLATKKPERVERELIPA